MHLFTVTLSRATIRWQDAKWKIWRDKMENKTREKKNDRVEENEC